MKKWIAVYAVAALIVIVLSFGTRDIAAVLLEGQPVARDHTIVIDPGHGGEDGGASSCTGALESGINLEISLRLRDLMELLGHRVVMIRTSDVSIYTKGETLAQKKISDLRQRVKIVSDIPDAVLISIHQNTYPQEKYSGAQVFFANTPGSEELARILQRSFTDTINAGSGRKSKESKGIYLMEHVQATAVLIECGFLSNIREDALLRDAAYQKKICCVIGTTVSQYLSNT